MRVVVVLLLLEAPQISPAVVILAVHTCRREGDVSSSSPSLSGGGTVCTIFEEGFGRDGASC